MAGLVPTWRRRSMVHGRIPASLRSWVYEPRSLTRRLGRHCAGAVAVEVLREGWRKPFRDEHGLLELADHEKALVRQVRLECGERPLVFAHSVIPRQTLNGPFRRLSRLGSRPLADVLFGSTTVVRETMEYARLMPAMTLHRLARQALDLDPDTALWGRRSCFRLRGRPLLVTEVFSPTLAHTEDDHDRTP